MTGQAWPRTCTARAACTPAGKWLAGVGQPDTQLLAPNPAAVTVRHRVPCGWTVFPHFTGAALPCPRKRLAHTHSKPPSMPSFSQENWLSPRWSCSIRCSALLRVLAFISPGNAAQLGFPYPQMLRSLLPAIPSYCPQCYFQHGVHPSLTLRVQGPQVPPPSGRPACVLRGLTRSQADLGITDAAWAAAREHPELSCTQRDKGSLSEGILWPAGHRPQRALRG